MKINHCGICGWYGMSWSWIYAFGTSKNKPLFQCDRPQNKFQGRSILWLLSCGKHRRWSQYISIISHLSHFTIKHPFGSARILPKKENYIRNKKNTSSTPPKSYSLIIIDLLSGHMFNSKVVGCNSMSYSCMKMFPRGFRFHHTWVELRFHIPSGNMNCCKIRQYWNDFLSYTILM